MPQSMVLHELLGWVVELAHSLAWVILIVSFFYSILRMFSEIFREPDIHLGYFFNYLSMGVILSSITLLAGCLIIFFVKKNEQNN